MYPNRLSAKFFLENPDALALGLVMPVFQRWIQENHLPGLLIDVVDYKHVHEGPGIILIAHEGDYGLDLGDGKPGLLYVRKREFEGDLQARLRLVVAHALDAAQKLQEEATLGGLLFDFSTVKIAFPDRLAAPNTPETLDALRDDLTAALTGVFGGGELTLTRAHDDPRELFAVVVQAQQNATLEPLTAELAGN